jgi:hypothetical protein
MDDTLRLIQYLYDEDVDDAAIARRLSEDEELYREYERLRAMKERLDERPSRRPEPAVVDRVVEEARTAAQSASPAPRRNGDRSARPPTRTWSRRLQTASAALALVLLVGLGWWQWPNTSDPSTAVSSAETAQRTAPAPAETRDDRMERVPAWDDSDELVRIHRRIEQLRAQSTPGRWGTLQQVDRSRP